MMEGFTWFVCKNKLLQMLYWSFLHANASEDVFKVAVPAWRTASNVLIYMCLLQTCENQKVEDKIFE